MIFPYQASNLGDISLAANEKMLVLNADDPHWLYVEDEHRVKGFVPATFVEWNGLQPGTRNIDRFVEQVNGYYFYEIQISEPVSCGRLQG